MEVTQDKKFMTVTLFSGQSYSESEEKGSAGSKRYPFQRQSFKKQVINISLRDFEFNRADEKRYSGASKMMNISQLESIGDSMFTDYQGRIGQYSLMFTYLTPINMQISWQTHKNDSAARKPDIKAENIIDFDKKIASMTVYEKQMLYHRAVEYVRTNMQNINQRFDEMYARKRTTNSFVMEWHRKFTLSFACLIFFFIGAPLGAIIRRGGLGMPVVVSILLFIAYYIIMITGEKFAREDAWSMTSGMWLASAVFLPIGIWLTYKAATDSSIMNSESYQMLFKKLGELRLRKRSKN
jgi:lipopolysaccharide export system permease protein